MKSAENKDKDKKTSGYIDSTKQGKRKHRQSSAIKKNDDKVISRISDSGSRDDDDDGANRA